MRKLVVLNTSILSFEDLVEPFAALFRVFVAIVAVGAAVVVVVVVVDF